MPFRLLGIAVAKEQDEKSRLNGVKNVIRKDGNHMKKEGLIKLGVDEATAEKVAYVIAGAE